jgi:DNA-binding MarR family transcriptional regulator
LEPLRRLHRGSDRRVSFVRLTAEGERRLALSFTALETKRRRLHEAIDQVEPT